MMEVSWVLGTELDHIGKSWPKARGRPRPAAILHRGRAVGVLHDHVGAPDPMSALAASASLGRIETRC